MRVSLHINEKELAFLQSLLATGFFGETIGSTAKKLLNMKMFEIHQTEKYLGRELPKSERKDVAA